MGLVLSDGRAVAIQPSAYSAVRESMNLVSRQLEDALWLNLSHDDRKLDDHAEDRVRLIKRARLAAKYNPLARTTIGLLQHYVLGQGITVKPKDRKRVGRLSDEFMHDPTNVQALTSHEALKTFLERAYVDGDYFLVLFPDRENGTLHLGRIDPTLVDDIVMDEQNDLIPRWYRVQKPSRTYDFTRDEWQASTPTTVYYRDWRNEDDPPKGLAGKLQEGLIYHVAWDKQEKFGRSGVAAALDWLNAHKQFMENRSTLNAAAAQVAWKKKRKGGASDIQQEAARLASTVSQTLTRMETNPPRATASTIVENDGSSLEWVKTDTGGQSADYDERKLRMMAGAGMGGIPNHYFGDEAAANLATATAMELPLLKMYEDRQQMVRQVLTDVLQFYLSVCHEAGRLADRDDSSRYADRQTTPQAVMAQPDQVPGAKVSEAGAVPSALMPYQAPPQAGGVRLIPKPQQMLDAEAQQTQEEPDPDEPVDWYIDIDFPPIIQKDVFIFMQALEKFAAMLPAENIEAKKFVVELALQTFGVNDIDKAMETIFPPDMVAVLVPPTPVNVDPATGKPYPPPEAGGPALPPGPQRAVAESLAAVRRRRMLVRVAEAAEDLVEVS